MLYRLGKKIRSMNHLVPLTRSLVFSHTHVLHRRNTWSVDKNGDRAQVSLLLKKRKLHFDVLKKI